MMRNSRKSKSASTKGAAPSEYTEGQLIIAICMALFAALTCFALGVFVGRYQREQLDVAGEGRVAQVDTPGTPAQSAAKQTAGQEGAQKSPRPVTMPDGNSSPRTPAFFSPADTKPKPWQDDVRQRGSEYPAPAKPVPVAKPVAKKPSPPEPPAKEDPEKEPKEEESKEPPKPAAAAKKPAPEPAAPPAKKPAVTKPPEEPVALAPLEPLVPLPTAPRTAGTSARKGTYGVQVASFSGPNRVESARNFKSQLEADSRLKPELLFFDAEQVVKVVVGSYATREAASKACKELNKQPGFSGCFVRQR